MQIQAVARSFSALDKYAEKLQPALALGARWYVAWVFLNSAYLKLTDWDQTLSLFETEYRVPLLSPFWGAITGTAGELIFSVLLILGLGGRFAPLGLFAVNAMAVISYAYVLLADDGICALRQHEFWGFILAMLAIYGMGPWSLDRLLANRFRSGSSSK